MSYVYTSNTTTSSTSFVLPVSSAPFSIVLSSREASNSDKGERTMNLRNLASGT